jgi:adenylate cyclase class 2
MTANGGSEVEIKFVVSDVTALEARLRRLAFRQKTAFTHEVNTIYDRPNGELRAKGELLRLRQYGESWKLTYKGRSENGRHKKRPEIESSVADGRAIEAILLALGFVPSFRYEKFRSEWTDGTGEVVVDLTPIGNLAEIEGSPAWIDSTAEQLGVSHERYITKSYATLFFEWKAGTNSPAEHMTFEQCGVAPPVLK